MTINWSLLGEPVDIGAKFQEGWDKTQARIKQAKTERALAAYAANPMDPAAQGALAAVSPQFAMQLGQMRMKTAAELAERQRRGSYFSMPDRKQAVAAAYAAGDVDVAEQLSKLDEGQQKRLRDMYAAMARVANGAKALPYEQRKPYIMANVDLLRANGVTDDLINSFDPTDQRLDGLIRDQLEVEKQLPDRTSVAPGGSVYEFDPVTSAGRTVVQQNPGTGGAPSLPPVLTDEEILRLENGGPTAGPSGGFP